MTSPSANNLALLRAQLEQQKLDGFLVPMADEYQSEYVPPSAQRIAFLSGFTGSAGLIIVLTDKAAFFTDSRYTLQASQQLPKELFAVYDSAVKTPSEWLKENLASTAKLGFDPWLHTETGVERLRKALTASDIELVAVTHNPVDAIWHDRPAQPFAPIVPHDIAYAGKSASDKRHELAAECVKHKLDAAVITDPASVAWLLNIRGGDVPHTPLPLSFAILYKDAHVDLFVDSRKITEGLSAHLGANVTIQDSVQFPIALKSLGDTKQKVRIDPAESAHWIVNCLRQAGADLDLGVDPCILPKACKNPTELEGARAAHRRDGAALAKFLAWLDENAPQGTVTEIQAEQKLAAFRERNNLYRGPSFDTIAGVGPNGAIVHYRATPQSNRTLEPNSLFLLDSGGQYLDGTTDVTRTVAIGQISDEMRDRFTRVLKGHIALASIVFPVGTSGDELDVLARQYLWAAGLDYGHGTGHGVGSYLGVHEGPQNISKRGNEPLKVGMVVSNEPGYYKNGHYGIRIENLQTVVESPALGERPMLGFETLTLAPIDKRAIDFSLLTLTERNWLNAYHTRVYEAIGSLVDEATKVWLKQVTAEI